MTKIQTLTFTTANFTKYEQLLSDTLIKGLPRKNIGFLISAPDTGKSSFAISLAYSGALGISLVPAVEPGKRFRTLYWPAEDIAGVFLRVKKHLETFSKEQCSAIQSSFAVFDSKEPLSSGVTPVNANYDVLTSLIETAKDYDLLILDTLRECMGPADEVDDDYFIKETLNHICEEANVSILAIHHPTKNVTRGLEAMSVVSGSGLSRTMANSRLHLFLQKEKNDRVLMRYAKANGLTQEQRQDVSLTFTTFGILCDETALNKSINQAEHKNDDIETRHKTSLTTHSSKGRHRQASQKGIEERIRREGATPSVIDLSDVESDEEQNAGDKEANSFLSSVIGKVTPGTGDT